MNGNWLVMTEDNEVLGVSWGEEDDHPVNIDAENMENATVAGIKRVSYRDHRLSTPTYVFASYQRVSFVLDIHETGQKIQSAIDSIEDIPKDLLIRIQHHLRVAQERLYAALIVVNANDMLFHAAGHRGERRFFKRVAWLAPQPPTQEQRWWWESRSCQVFEIDPSQANFTSGVDVWTAALRATGNKRPDFIVGVFPIALLPELLDLAGGVPVIRPIMRAEKTYSVGSPESVWTGEWQQLTSLDVAAKNFDL